MLKKRIFLFLKWFLGIVVVLFLSTTATLYIFKDDICNLAIAQVNKYLKVKVAVAEVDLAFWSSFPNLSVDFNEVFIQDSFEGATEQDTLLFTERIRCKFNPSDLWNEDYTIKAIELSPGCLNLKVNNEGSNNYDIIKEQSDSVESDGFELNLESINCKGLRFSYLNSVTDQEYRTAISEVEITGALSTGRFTAKAESDMTILAAKSGNINLVRNQPAKLSVGVNVNSDSSTVTIPASTIYVAGLPFNFEANYSKDGYQFSLNAKNIEIDDAANKLSLDQTSDVKRVSGTGKLIFDLLVKGESQADIPAVVTCGFGVENGTLKDPNSGITLANLNVDGKYSNQGGKDKEHLTLSKISFQSSGGLFNGDLNLTNFEAPEYKGSAHGLINLAIFHSLFKIPNMEEMKGDLDIASNFLIKTIPLEDGSARYQIEQCTGSLDIKRASFKIEEDKRHYQNITGKAYLKNDEIGVENIFVSLGRSDMNVNGMFRNLSAYFSGTGHLLADVEIKSKEINIADLGSDTKEEHVLQERTYMMPDNIEGSVYLNVAKLFYEGHSFYRLIGNMSIKERTIDFTRIAVRNGGADVTGSLRIEERRPEIFYLSSVLASKNIEFGSLFKEWNNFNQDVITSKNISGTAQATLTFDAPFDLRSGIISDAIEAQIGLQIDGGRLKNVETFKLITQSLRETPSARMAIGKENINAFEKKLLDLKFDQLKNTLVIKNSVLTIPSMSIKSNALDLEASGKHTFDNKIDYRFGFRFRDLKQEKESEFGELEDDGTGKYVFMRMYGELDNPTIEWDKVSSREKRKEYNQQEVQDAKSILKSEFGLFKNDTTVQEYIQQKRQHEILEVEFNPVDKIDTVLEKTTPKRDTKARRMLNNWKKDFQKEKEEEVEIEF